MSHNTDNLAGGSASATASRIDALLEIVDFSLTSKLDADPHATPDGRDHDPREVRSGHYVPVAPTPIANPEYISHSHDLFGELGLSDELAQDPVFSAIFSADLSSAPAPLRATGWATGYALSIYGTEYTQQCPFRTGNGYGDGRAISVAEVTRDGRRWELQLKGGGPTPYCRGGDGRAVLRSSVREFLAQELMHALGVPTSRSLSLYASKTEHVMRPWYAEGSRSFQPDIMKKHKVAISTRVAPSFLRVGQLELFARRTRQGAHPRAREELRKIVAHAIEREYAHQIDQELPFGEQVLALASCFRARLTALVANWLRVGYCQGNFNSDNCAVGGFTLDYGPFGFCDAFDLRFQPWTGGGEHFSFFNQPAAADANFRSFCSALEPLVEGDANQADALARVKEGFAAHMKLELQTMWASKMGLVEFDAALFSDLISLMQRARVDYTMFWRALSDIPTEIEPLVSTFYAEPTDELLVAWGSWLGRWRAMLGDRVTSDRDQLSSEMKRVNPRYTWREWLVVSAYEHAERGDYELVRELQSFYRAPYAEQDNAIAAASDQKRPIEFAGVGGVAHYSCSS